MMDDDLRHESDDETPAPDAAVPAFVSKPSETEQARRRMAVQATPEVEKPVEPVEPESRRERRAREKAEREAAKVAAREDKERQKAEDAAAKEAAKAEEAAAKEAAKAEKQAAKNQSAEEKEAAKAEKQAAKNRSADEKEAANVAAKAEKEAQKEAAKAAKVEARAAKKAGKGKKAKSDDRREKKLVGLKIGASQIAAARVHNNGSPELIEAVREPLEPGLVVSGEIRDATALAGALERFFERHKLPKKGVRLGLSNNRIGVRVFEIEGVEDERQLENAIRFRAEEVLPIPLDEAVLDYVVLGDAVREDGTSVRRILLVVAYREVVDRYLEACRGAGLEVVGIDLEAFAILRSLHAPTEEPPGGGALVVVAVGHDRTTIAVSTGRYCEFTRVLDWGGFALNVAIARALDRAPSEVESIKRHVSFAEVVEVEGLDEAQSQGVHEAAQRALAGFARELVASLHFYQAQPGALGIGEIVLTGGATHMTGFADAVGRLIGAPVRLGDPFSRVKLGKSVAHEDQAGSFAVAVGLGIED
jgi:type IV pilus assembly protein PilM